MAEHGDRVFSRTDARGGSSRLKTRGWGCLRLLVSSGHLTIGVSLDHRCPFGVGRLVPPLGIAGGASSDNYPEMFARPRNRKPCPAKEMDYREVRGPSARSAPARSSGGQPALILPGPSRMIQTARSRSVPLGFRFSGRSHRRARFPGRDIVPSFSRSRRAWCSLYPPCAQ